MTRRLPSPALVASLALAIAFALALASSAAEAQTVQRIRRPPRLSPPPACELYRGITADNNDPTLRVELSICVEGRQVRGERQGSSLTSGWSKREVRGELSEDGQRMTLHDVRFVHNEPAQGWRFCLVDRYSFRREGPDRLVGDYVAEGCDHGRMEFTRVPEGDRPQTDRPETAAASTADSPAPPAEPPPELPREGLFACALRPAIGGGRRASSALALACAAALIGAWALRRRRPGA